MEEFFNLSNIKKTKYSYSGFVDNLGYCGLTEERLIPNKPGDLKEAFNWKSSDKMKDQYWPEEILEFKPLAQLDSHMRGNDKVLTDCRRYA